MYKKCKINKTIKITIIGETYKLRYLKLYIMFKTKKQDIYRFKSI